MSRPAIKCSWRFVGHFHSMGRLSFVEYILKDFILILLYNIINV